jgi:DNA polymerase I-like protein with 3'-5' exonuclease and polymerase domains
MLVALDFETTGLEMWSPKHSVTSIAIAWGDVYIQSEYANTPENIDLILKHLHDTQQPVVVYNVGFELMVLKCKFPQYSLNIVWDCMRLVQNYDNRPQIMSYGLKDAAKRILLEEDASWEAEAHSYLAANKMKKSELSRLPPDILRRYNIGDAVATLKLTHLILDYFFEIGFDPRIDHVKYLSTAKEVVDSQIRGIRVDREGIKKYLEAIKEELAENEEEFKTTLQAEIGEVERIITEKEQAKFKKKIVSHVPFNIDSNLHREILFTKVMGLPTLYTTPKGKPSLKKAHLKQFGEAASKLDKRKNRQIVMAQLENLLELSEEDGRWHVSLKLAGTSTGRFAGGNQ